MNLNRMVCLAAGAPRVSATGRIFANFKSYGTFEHCTGLAANPRQMHHWNGRRDAEPVLEHRDASAIEAGDYVMYSEYVA